MSGVARRTHRTSETPETPEVDDRYEEADADASSDSDDREDRSEDGRDVESDEYGSLERSCSETSDRDSGEPQEGDKKTDDAVKSQVVDHDEDRRNPQYIPKKGTFYEHDDRTAPGAEEDGTAVISDGLSVLDISRTDRSGPNDAGDKTPAPLAAVERRKTPKSGGDRWLHDKYNENDQAPKSSEELMAIYGYDIRGEEGPPKAFRRHRYGRGPNKYTRNWEDENAYGKGLGSGVRTPKAPPSVLNGKEFPALQSKNDRNRIEKRKKVDKKIRVIDSKMSPDKNATDKIIHDNKVFINRNNKIDRDMQEKRIITDEIPRWKSRAAPKTDIRKPVVALKNQSQPQEQTRQEVTQVNSSTKPAAVISSQSQSNQSPVIIPLQENKLPPARKLNPSQVPPRMQPVTPTTVPPATNITPVTSSAAQADGGTRGKRYSNLRQRPMLDNYQPHQQYVGDYQQPPVPSKTTQPSLPSMGTLPLTQQTPPPLLQTTAHHQPVPQLHRQTPPPSLHQTGSQIHQKSAQILQPSPQIHQQSQQIIQQSNQIHTQPTQLHQQPSQIHQQTNQILQQQTTQLHQQSPQIHQQTTQMHQQNSQMHQQSPSIHQQTPPPALQPSQTHHQTPPPAHQSINRQQASLPMRQVPRTHQQQMTLHSMTIPQGGLVASQSYATPQMIAQNQYLQSPNGTVYGHVVPQVYPPPQAYAAPQHQAIPPQALPPQALPPQAMPPQALPPQAMPPQALPPQTMPPQGIPPHTYHHQTAAPQHQPPPYPAHTGRPVYRESTGITYYRPEEQKGALLPTRRPTNAIPIVPPPSKDRGKMSDAVPPPIDNIDRIVDNMFVLRQDRTVRPSDLLRGDPLSPRRLEEEIARAEESRMVRTAAEEIDHELSADSPLLDDEYEDAPMSEPEGRAGPDTEDPPDLDPSDGTPSGDPPSSPGPTETEPDPTLEPEEVAVPPEATRTTEASSEVPAIATEDPGPESPESREIVSAETVVPAETVEEVTVPPADKETAAESPVGDPD